MNIFHYISRHIVRLLPILFFFLALLRPLPSSAGKMVLHVYQEAPKEKISLIPYRMLLGRMEMLLKKNGFDKGKSGDRFLLAPVVTLVSRDSQPGSPAKITVKLSLKLSIGDGLDGTRFATVTLPLEGSGQNESVAYVAAYRTVVPDNKEVVALFNSAREKIAAFYTKNCGAIIKGAQEIAAKEQYEAALLKLLMVPDTCKECVMSAMEAATPVYQKYLNQMAVSHLNLAKKVWSKEQNFKNAEIAFRHLALIDPDAAGYADAIVYFDQISAYLKSNGKEATPDSALKKPYQGDEKTKARNLAYKQIVDHYLNDVGVTTIYNVGNW